VQRVYRLAPEVDTAALLASFRHAVAHREALRLQLVKTRDGWRQRFPKREANISGVTVRGATAAHREEYVRCRLIDAANRVFDLTKEPPFAANVFAFDDERLLSVGVDHLAVDEIGFDRFERDWEEAYRRYVSDDGSAPAANGDRAFIDYVRREVAGADKEAANLEFWRSHLFGAPLAPSVGAGDGWVSSRSARWQIEGDDFRRLARACRVRGCSLFAAVVSAQADLIAALGGSADFVLNIPVSNRARHDDLAIVGNLSMLLHVRVRVDLAESPPSRLRRMRDTLLAAMAHRQYDYPSLSALVAEQASADASGPSRTHWTIGCSFTVEPPDTDASPRVLQRTDPFAGDPFDTPFGAFTLTCRQHAGHLRFTADWDPATWPATEAQLVQRYVAGLSAFADGELEFANVG
jgi:hypothetical protein